MLKTTVSPMRSALVALASAAALWACADAAHATSRADPGIITHLCGGVGAAHLKALKAQAHAFNLGFWMVEGPHGAYLADVPIQIKTGGRIIATFTAEGPLCYLKVPAGEYTIVGSHKSQTRAITAHSGSMNDYLRW
ncbi:hypothetical protein [Thiomonas sp. FB-Cd]|uniref:hypothetical protein n=1 Tax=Thiomonas sp. FB-Cd TaxID=1158292 RepID=UPI000A8CF335|nr:hypothetical protein [Thiomonas sp. FB-Cd]